MTTLSYNTAIVVGGASLLGGLGGLTGSLAFLRKRVLVGDSLAHAALPGICVAFLLSGERQFFSMFVGALLSGLLGVAAMLLIRRVGRLPEDVALGAVLSVFFGAGIALSRMIQSGEPLARCGEWLVARGFTSLGEAVIARAKLGSQGGLDHYLLGQAAGMIASDLILVAIVFAVVLAITLLFFKELKLVAFDGDFASAQGWPATRIDFAMTAMVAVAVVAGLPAAGVALVAALIVLPAVAARFWTDSFGWLLTLATGFGGAMGALGAIASAQSKGAPTGPMITLVGTALLAISAVLAPRRGIIARWRVATKQKRDLAAHLWLLHVADSPANSTTPLAPRLVSTMAARGKREALSRGWLIFDQGEWRLTETGVQEANHARDDELARVRLLDERPDLARRLAYPGFASEMENETIAPSAMSATAPERRTS